MRSRKVVTPQAIRWSDIPHDTLLQRSHLSLTTGSRERAKEDSLRHVLKPRLPKLESTDHLRYIEIECARIVEVLRAIRDAYRTYLQEKGCEPIADMYWVVFRFGLIPNALAILRAAIFDYISNSKIDQVSWTCLFGTLTRPGPLKSKEMPWETQATGIIESLTREQDLLNLSFTGGMFGREAQGFIGRLRPWPGIFLGQMTFMEHIEMREALWDSCYPWTECIARLFDTVRQELIFQGDGILEDGRRAESKYVALSALQRIAYKHLQKLRQGAEARAFGPNGWRALLQELDCEGVSLNELDGKAKEVRAALLRKNFRIDSWEQCYDSSASVSLEDGNTYTLKRQTTISIHNAARAAKRHLGKVWNVKEVSPSEPTGKRLPEKSTRGPRGKVIGKAPDGLRGEDERKALMAHPSGGN